MGADDPGRAGWHGEFDADVELAIARIGQLGADFDPVRELALGRSEDISRQVEAFARMFFNGGLVICLLMKMPLLSEGGNADEENEEAGERRPCAIRFS